MLQSAKHLYTGSGRRHYPSRLRNFKNSTADISVDASNLMKAVIELGFRAPPVRHMVPLMMCFVLANL